MLNAPQLTPTQWIQLCAERLHERWHTVAQEQLEEVATEIWTDDRLRHMPPAEAAAAWLQPLAGLASDSRV